MAAKDSVFKIWGFYGLLYIPNDWKLDKVARVPFFYTKDLLVTNVPGQIWEM